MRCGKLENPLNEGPFKLNLGSDLRTAENRGSPSSKTPLSSAFQKMDEQEVRQSNNSGKALVSTGFIFRI
jgi:hypothetical protein